MRKQIRPRGDTTKFTREKITMSWLRLHKDEPEYFVIKMGDHPLELPQKRRDWHPTPLQSGAVLLLTMGALTALVIWLIVSHSQL
jgi:hypothetical protein